MIVYAIINDMGETVAIEPTAPQAEQKAVDLQLDDILDGTYTGGYRIERKELEDV